MTTASPALLVPPVRLGRLLGEAREAHGESYDDLVRRCGLAFDDDFFARVEAGQAELDEPLVRWLTELYGVGVSELVPNRSELIIDLTEGQVAIGDRQVSLPGRDADQILTNYLALVYALRGQSISQPIPLREVDLRVLGDALELPVRSVGRSLERMMTSESAAVRTHARGLRRRLVVPVAGILVGVTAVGGLLLVRSADVGAGGPTPAVPALGAAAVAPPVQIGEAVVLERAGVGDTGATQMIRTN